MLMSIDSTMNSLYSRGANASTARDFRFLQGSTEKLRIKASGDINIVNNVNVVGVSTFTGAIDANGDIDVDGHTNLDNVSVAGVSTLTTLRIGNTNDITSILDEDNFASNSATALATQQSIKAYIDTNVTAQDLDFVGDSGTGSVDLDSQSLDIEGTANEIETVAANQKITIGLPNDVTIGNDCLLYTSDAADE